MQNKSFYINSSFTVNLFFIYQYLCIHNNIKSLFMIKIIYLAAAILVFSTLHAQKKTMIKTSLTGISAKSYTFELERTLTRKISVGASYRTMPTRLISFADQIIKYGDITDADIKNALSNMQMGSTALNVEARLYLGKKGYGKGFYLGAYFRNTKFNVDALPITVTDGISTRSIKTNGDMKISGGGLLIGTQFFIAKRICIDLQLIGIGAANSTLNLDATPTPALTATEQTDIRNSLNSLTIPGVNLATLVTANSVKATGSGTMPWVRSSFTVGLRF